MIISPEKKKCLIEIGEYEGKTYKTVWRMGEFSVDKLPEEESDGSITLDPSTLIGCWDQWETEIPSQLRGWDFDMQPIGDKDFLAKYKVKYYKIFDGYRIN